MAYESLRPAMAILFDNPPLLLLPGDIATVAAVPNFSGFAITAPGATGEALPVLKLAVAGEEKGEVPEELTL
jgi:hypothetical protein